MTRNFDSGEITYSYTSWLYSPKCVIALLIGARKFGAEVGFYFEKELLRRQLKEQLGTFLLVRSSKL